MNGPHTDYGHGLALGLALALVLGVLLLIWAIAPGAMLSALAGLTTAFCAVWLYRVLRGEL